MDLFGTAGGLWSNKQNRDFAEEMAGSQYQRAVADMKNAGLNPNAVFGSGGGSQAASPGGQSENPVKGEFGSSAQSILDMGQSATEISKGQAMTDVAKAQADQTRASAKIAESNAEVTKKENSAYSKTLDTPFGKTLATVNKYAGPVTQMISGLGGAAAKGLGSVWGGYSSAKQAEFSGGQRKESAK